MNAYEQYIKELAIPMREELTNNNFEELTEAESVTSLMETMNSDDTLFVVVNSICGCAAGIARPAAVTVATQNPIKPTKLATVFAGQDKEATEMMRSYIDEVPTSPSFALFKGKELLKYIPRERIEGRVIEDLMYELKDLFDAHCTK